MPALISREISLMFASTVGGKTVFALGDLSQQNRGVAAVSIGSRLIDMCLAILPIGERTTANLAGFVGCVPALFDASSVRFRFVNSTGSEFHDHSSERLLNAPLPHRQARLKSRLSPNMH
jgi:hypothetical protein